MILETLTFKREKLQVPLEKGTFQDTAAALFNNLPENPKKCDISMYLVCTFLNS